FDQMETFARYGFNKSHSAAYALISYHTAYLKAHFSVEFMAALMSSERGDTDKVIKNLAECREREIEVLPPDINESRSDFTVVGDKIRFGLAAVKNVGEKAVEVILAAREGEGAFRSIFDFCRRVDLSAVNRRVVESLIKCGAFDSTQVAPRARIMAALDDAIREGQSYQKERESNQTDIFSLLGGGNGNSSRRENYPLVAEWSAQQMLAFEKEALGFYITGHPLDKHENVLKRSTSGSIASLKEKPFSGEVKVGGVVTALKLKNTKKGERYASFQLEDKTGFIEVIVWPDVYRRVAETLVLDDPILVQGKLEMAEERAQIIANDVNPLQQLAGKARAKPAPAATEREKRDESVHFYVRVQQVEPQDLGQLRDTLLQFPGSAPVFLHLVAAEGETVVELPDRLRVELDPSLLEEVKKVFGPRISATP
ncbi:MAG: OB-fold nucleic acid binding domain-containing protein, partial [Candidatus Binatia bacterium]